MAKVVLDMAMSLDGFVAGLKDEHHGLYDWYFDPAPNSKAVIDEILASTGAIVMGKRTYNSGLEQGGFEDNPYKIPHFILSHHPQEKILVGDASFTFVTDGIESLVAQAKIAAGDRDVAIGGGANIAQQCLQAELVDEIQIHLAPILIAQGIRLFNADLKQLTQLENTRVIVSPTVTHLRFRVIKQA